MFISISTLHTWLEQYAESYSFDLTELYQSHDQPIYGMRLGENADSNHTIDKLLEFPHHGTFVAYVEEESTAPSVQVLHHFFKMSAVGVTSRSGRCGAWMGLATNVTVPKTTVYNTTTSNHIFTLKWDTTVLQGFALRRSS